MVVVRSRFFFLCNFLRECFDYIEVCRFARRATKMNGDDNDDDVDELEKLC